MRGKRYKGLSIQQYKELGVLLKAADALLREAYYGGYIQDCYGKSNPVAK